MRAAMRPDFHSMFSNASNAGPIEQRQNRNAFCSRPSGPRVRAAHPTGDNEKSCGKRIVSKQWKRCRFEVQKPVVERQRDCVARIRIEYVAERRNTYRAPAKPLDLPAKVPLVDGDRRPGRVD